MFKLFILAVLSFCFCFLCDQDIFLQKILLELRKDVLSIGMRLIQLISTWLLPIQLLHTPRHIPRDSVVVIHCGI